MLYITQICVFLQGYTQVFPNYLQPIIDRLRVFTAVSICTLSNYLQLRTDERFRMQTVCYRAIHLSLAACHRSLKQN